MAQRDRQWYETFDVVLEPNPELTVGQKRAVELDYNMHKGHVVVSVKCALLYYFYKRLRLDVAEYVDEARERPVVVRNLTEFEAALENADVPISTAERLAEKANKKRISRLRTK